MICLQLICQKVAAAPEIRRVTQSPKLTQNEFTVPPLDVVFVLDGSGSVRLENFELMQDWVKSVTQGFDLEGSTRVGIVQYSGEVTTEINLGNDDDHDSFEAAVDGIIYHSGEDTNTAQAIDKAVSEFNKFKRSNETGTTRRVMIVHTDGNSSDIEALKISAKAARDAGIMMIAVGVGEYNLAELQIIGTGVFESERQLYTLESAEDLNATATSLANEAEGLIEGPVLSGGLVERQAQWCQFIGDNVCPFCLSTNSYSVNIVGNITLTCLSDAASCVKSDQVCPVAETSTSIPVVAEEITTTTSNADPSITDQSLTTTDDINVSGDGESTSASTSSTIFTMTTSSKEPTPGTKSTTVSINGTATADGVFTTTHSDTQTATVIDSLTEEPHFSTTTKSDQVLTTLMRTTAGTSTADSGSTTTPATVASTATETANLTSQQLLTTLNDTSSPNGTATTIRSATVPATTESTATRTVGVTTESHISTPTPTISNASTAATGSVTVPTATITPEVTTRATTDSHDATTTSDIVTTPTTETDIVATATTKLIEPATTASATTLRNETLGIHSTTGYISSTTRTAISIIDVISSTSQSNRTGLNVTTAAAVAETDITETLRTSTSDFPYWIIGLVAALALVITAAVLHGMGFDRCGDFITRFTSSGRGPVTPEA